MFSSLFVKMKDNQKVWGNLCFRDLEFAHGDLCYCAPPRQAASITTCGGVSVYVVVQSLWWIQQFWFLSFLSNEFRILHVFKTLFINLFIQSAATLWVLNIEYRPHVATESCQSLFNQPNPMPLLHSLSCTNWLTFSSSFFFTVPPYFSLLLVYCLFFQIICFCVEG